MSSTRKMKLTTSRRYKKKSKLIRQKKICMYMCISNLFTRFCHEAINYITKPVLRLAFNWCLPHCRLKRIKGRNELKSSLLIISLPSPPCKFLFSALFDVYGDINIFYKKFIKEGELYVVRKKS